MVCTAVLTKTGLEAKEDEIGEKRY